MRFKTPNFLSQMGKVASPLQEGNSARKMCARNLKPRAALAFIITMAESDTPALPQLGTLRMDSQAVAPRAVWTP